MANIKVQFTDGRVTAASLINPRSKGKKTGRLTFHAFSDRMKAGVLQMIAEKNPIEVSVTEEPPVTGEWLE